MKTTSHKIFVLNAHPDEGSFVEAIAKAYYTGALQSGLEIRLVYLRELSFDPSLDLVTNKINSRVTCFSNRLTFSGMLTRVAELSLKLS